MVGYPTPRASRPPPRGALKVKTPSCGHRRRHGRVRPAHGSAHLLWDQKEDWPTVRGIFRPQSVGYPLVLGVSPAHLMWGLTEAPLRFASSIFKAGTYTPCRSQRTPAHPQPPGAPPGPQGHGSFPRPHPPPPTATTAPQGPQDARHGPRTRDMAPGRATHEGQGVTTRPRRHGARATRAGLTCKISHKMRRVAPTLRPSSHRTCAHPPPPAPTSPRGRCPTPE